MHLVQLLSWFAVFGFAAYGFCISVKTETSGHEQVMLFIYACMAFALTILMALGAQWLLPIPGRDFQSILTMQKLGMTGAMVVVGYMSLAFSVGVIFGQLIKRSGLL